MPQRRISMRLIREVLRHYHEKGSSKRRIATDLLLSPGTVRNYLRRAAEVGLTWPLPDNLTDVDLEGLLFPTGNTISVDRPLPDWAEISKQLSWRGMTLERVWKNYITVHPDGYSYGHFCALYKEWSGMQKISMRLHHKAGEELYVDFAGTTVEITDPKTGEVTKAQIFVAALGCSNYTYVEAVPDQTIRSWIGAHVRAMDFFGRVPEVIVCDNLKAAVVQTRGKHPKIQPTYLDFAHHYGTRIRPARVRRPQDKSLAELAVKFATTRILTSVRTQTFFSIWELNQAIAPLLKELNDLPFQKKPGSRRSQFEELDHPVMDELPETRYEFVEWKKLKVSIDYHISADFCYYSVPYRFRQKRLDVALGETLVRCYYKNELVTTHVRMYSKGTFSTDPDHMPEQHRRYHDREWLISQARQIGPQMERLIDAVLDRRSHQEQNFRSALGILKLKDSYSAESLESACFQALRLGTRAHNYPTIAGILKNKSGPLDPSDPPIIQHKNIRGGEYYANPPSDDAPSSSTEST